MGRRYEAGIPVPTLAGEFGVSTSTVYMTLVRLGVRAPRRTGPRISSLTSWDNAPRPPKKPHVIEDISYAREWLLCSCGFEVTARRDELEHDRHLPLVIAWTAHRREVGARVLSVAQDAMFRRAYS
jgi:hypothetical protein